MKLAALLIKGLSSGDAISADRSYWMEKRRTLSGRYRKSKAR